MARIWINHKDVLVSECHSAVWKLLTCQINGTPPDQAVLKELERLRRKADALGYNLDAETTAQVEAHDNANH